VPPAADKKQAAWRFQNSDNVPRCQCWWFAAKERGMEVADDETWGVGSRDQMLGPSGSCGLGAGACLGALQFEQHILTRVVPVASIHQIISRLHAMITYQDPLPSQARLAPFLLERSTPQQISHPSNRFQPTSFHLHYISNTFHILSLLPSSVSCRSVRRQRSLAQVRSAAAPRISLVRPPSHTLTSNRRPSAHYILIGP
jgi:hypothetical protein